jgi:two-component system CheB/CheR fusion protein
LPFPVVGIGASAGGLEALEALTQRLAPDRMAFVVVQHLAPGHVSMLADILQRGTPLRVKTIDDGMALEAGVIYVAPPSAEVSIRGEVLTLGPLGSGPGGRHSIDAFFRSLAAAGGPMAVGVVLSGSGTDGTLGLKEIKDEGGITFVQEPSGAAQPSMPQSAADAGYADFALTPAEIGRELMRLSAHPYVGKARPPQLSDRHGAAKLFAELRAAFGVDFALYKSSTVDRRIGRRMALHKLENVDEYLKVLAANPIELRNLYNDLLIGVTSFFRDAEPFEAMKTIVFPRLLQNRSEELPVRIWVAGCSTGEEAYSIAIAIVEFLGDRARAFKIQVFATDIDENALARARTAVYSPNIDLDLSPERLQRFFVKNDKGYQVSRQIRDMVVFARHNLGKDPPFSRLDLVTCRNVLIYLQSPLQKKVLRIFHYALNPDAYLLLGTSESVGDTADLFVLVDRKLKVYAKKNLPATAAFEMPLASGRPLEEHEGAAVAADRRPIIGLAQLADRKVIEKYAPPGVIVDEKLDIMQFRGRIGQFLEPAPGVATLNLLKLARPELLIALRATVTKAFAEGVATTSPPVPLWGDDGSRTVTLEVLPLTDGAGRRLLLVLFDEAAPATPRPLDPERETATDPGSSPRLLEVERELATTKEYLQSTIEELEAANEELQSSNEELQSSNEELQSTNEELETSKEELQSTNEELATVNDELHNRMLQLSVANDDLQNVLLSSHGAIVILGSDLRIRRFSQAAEKLLSLIPGDVGRPIGYLRNVVSGRDIDQLAADAMSTVSPREQRVRCFDGFWYMMRMVPYVTADQMIRGLVLEFVRTTAPNATPEYEPITPVTAQVLSAIPQALMLIDRQLNLVWANRPFFETFSVGAEIMGTPLAEAFSAASEPAELWAFLEALVAGGDARDVLVDHPFGRTTEQPMRFSGRVVRFDTDRAFLAVVFVVPV